MLYVNAILGKRRFDSDAMRIVQATQAEYWFANCSCMSFMSCMRLLAPSACGLASTWDARRCSRVPFGRLYGACLLTANKLAFLVLYFSIPETASVCGEVSCDRASSASACTCATPAFACKLKDATNCTRAFTTAVGHCRKSFHISTEGRLTSDTIFKTNCLYTF